MLKKLLKYEYKASVRSFAGVYLALLFTAAFVGVFFGLDGLSEPSRMVPEFTIPVNGSTLGYYAVTIGVLAYFGLCVAMFVLFWVNTCQRFYRNLLGSEGYLMHTLPVSPAQLIVSKLMMAFFWLLMSVVVLALSLAILTLAAWRYVSNVPIDFSQFAFVRVDCYLLAMLPLVLFQFVALVLCLYLSMMVGHQFTKGVVPGSIIAFFVINGVKSTLAVAVVQIFLFDWIVELQKNLPFVAIYWMDNILCILGELVFIVLYFIATTYLMRKRLNLV